MTTLEKLIQRNLSIDGKRLSLYGHHIADVKDVKFPDGLQVLSLGGNQIADVKGVKFPDGLQVLGLDGNQIADVKDAHFPDGLQALYLGDNLLADISKLRFTMKNGTYRLYGSRLVKAELGGDIND